MSGRHIIVYLDLRNMGIQTRAFDEQHDLHRFKRLLSFTEYYITLFWGPETHARTLVPSAEEFL